MPKQFLKFTVIMALIAIVGITFAPSHTTQAATINQTSTPNTPIVDLTTITDTINVTSTEFVTDVNVQVTITHGWISDLDMSLTHIDTGRTIQLMDDVCTAFVNVSITFDDSSGAPVGSGCTSPYSGTFRPQQALSAYTNEVASGDWQLSVYDDTATDEGTLVSWTLNITTSATLIEVCTTDCPTSPDGRLNWQMGDDVSILYPASDNVGRPSMHIYCATSNASGFLAMVINGVDLPDTSPTANTLIDTYDGCNVEFWALAEGSQFLYQVNIGPNIDGTVYELLFNNIGGENMILRTFNLYQLDK